MIKDVKMLALFSQTKLGGCVDFFRLSLFHLSFVLSHGIVHEQCLFRRLRNFNVQIKIVVD